MSKTAKAIEHPAYQMVPIWDTTLKTIREWAAELNEDPDALALHLFDTELDNLLEWQAREIYTPLFKMRLARTKRPGHDATCFSCERDFTCFCSRPGHDHGECAACHEGISPGFPPSFDHSITLKVKVY